MGPQYQGVRVGFKNQVNSLGVRMGVQQQIMLLGQADHALENRCFDVVAEGVEFPYGKVFVLGQVFLDIVDYRWVMHPCRYRSTPAIGPQ